jgi:UDP-N-acetylenolpyruvoylglucosamine reductase
MPTRFLFDPPRRPKPKVRPNIKSLFTRCHSTSKLTDAGRTIEEKRWRTAKMKTQKFTRAHYGSVFESSQAQVRDLRSKRDS